MRLAAPWRFKIGPERQQHQNWITVAFLDQRLDKFECCGVDPMQVLDDEQNRLKIGHLAKPIVQQ